MGNQFDRILLSIFYKDYLAPVVQWIEHWSPEPKIWVRLPAGVPVSKRVVAFRVNSIKKNFL
jgi:hypothetical protein